MRVLVLGSTYPPHALGGYELSCHDVVTRWRRAGHEVEVLATDLRVSGVPEVEEPHVRRDLRWYWDDHRLLDPSLRGQLRLERHDQRVLQQALAEKPDVISVWAMGALPMGLVTTAVRSGIPVVLVVCDDWLDYGPRVDPWSRRFLDHPRRARLAERLTGLPTRLPDDLDARVTTVFVSEHCRAFARDRTRWAFADSVVVPSGIDRDDFPAAAPVARPWTGRLLGVGRLEPRKGFATAVQALRELPGCTLQLVGQPDPTHVPELRTLAEGLPVTFDAVPRAQLSEVYGAADALLFPSAWQEPFGLVPLEAMACATPVVAVASGGAAEYLEDGTNALVVEADPGQMAAAVRRLAADPDLRAHLVAGGLRTAQHYTTHRLATELEQVHLAALR